MEKRDERKSPAVGLRNFSFLYYLFYVPESRILSGAGGGSPPSPSLIAGRRRPEGTRRRCRKIPSSRKARFGEGGGSLRGEGGVHKGAGSLLWYFGTIPESLLLPGAGGGSPPRRGGAGGERGRSPSTPPTPPYSPQSGNAKSFFPAPQFPVRRAAQGASARTFPPLRDGRCPRLLRRSVRPPGVRDRLRARATLHYRRKEERPSLGREKREKSTGGEGADGEKEKKQRRPARSEGNNRVFLRNDRPSLFPLFIPPGDGGRRESGGVAVKSHPPEKRVLGRERGV